MTVSSLTDVVSLGQLELAQPPLTAELVTEVAGLVELRAAWEALHAATGSANPFAQWTWVVRWWQQFAQRKVYARDRLHLVVLRDEHGIVRGIAPFVLTRWGLGPVAVCALRLYGYNGSFTELREPLVWPGWEHAVANALVARLRADRRLYHWCVLPGLITGDALEQSLAAHAEPGRWTWHSAVQDYVLPLPGTWDAFRSGLKRNIKESLRHCYNSLRRDGHEYTFEAISDPAELPEALEEFFRLHAARAAMPGAQSHPDHYATPERRQFMRLVAQDLAARDRLMVCRLRINGEVVASRIVMAAGDTLYLYYSGYNPEWSRYSVMTTLTAECVKLAIDRGLSAVNLSTGTDVSKTRWGPAELTYRSLRIVAPTVVARIVVAMYDRSVKSGMGTRQTPRRIGQRMLRLVSRRRDLLVGDRKSD